MNTKHTPGPWHVTGKGLSRYVEGRVRPGVLQEVAWCGATEVAEQMEANARLIAAAPELLEALEAIDDAAVNDMGLDDASPTWAAIKRARSVVEKATSVHKPRFENTYCSQCGGEFGPSDSGYSHCADHRKATGASHVSQQ